MTTHKFLKGRVFFGAVLAASVAAAALVGGCRFDVDAGDEPMLSAQSVSAYVDTATGTTAELKFTSGEAGTYFAVAYAPETAPPESGRKIEEVISSGAGNAVTGAAVRGANRVPLSGLKTDTKYCVHLTVKYAGGGYSAVWSSEPFKPTAERVAPVLSRQSVSAYAGTATGTSATLSFTSSEGGVYFAAVYPSTMAAPASGALLSAGAAGGVMKSGTAVAGVNVVVFSGLAVNTECQVHVTVRDAAGNYSMVWSSGLIMPTQSGRPALSLQGESVFRDTNGVNIFQIIFISNRAGTCFMAAAPTGVSIAAADGAALEGVFNSGGAGILRSSGAAVTGVNVMELSGLTEGTEYRFYVTVKDASGNYSDVLGGSFTSGEGSPVLSERQASVLQDTGGLIALLQFTSSKAGTCFAVVAPLGVTVPANGAAVEVIYNNASIKRSQAVAAGSGAIVTVSGLSAAEACRMHVTVKDGEGNYSAVWSPPFYAVTCEAGEGTVSPAEKVVAYGASYTLAVPVRAGYKFEGWYSGEGGTGTQLTDANGAGLGPWGVGGDVTVYARWGAAQYWVTYNADGGTAAATQALVTYGASYTLVVPVRANFGFVGWYSGAGGTGTQLTGANGASLAPWAATSGAVVYARWAGTMYPVTYDATGGTVSPTAGTAAYNAYYTLAVPVREGYTFMGWYSGAGGTGTRLTDAKGVSVAPWAATSGAVVYAKWTVESAYRVTYDAAGGTVSPAFVMVIYGSEYRLDVPARVGYVFGGWYAGAEGTGTQFTYANGEGIVPWAVGGDVTAHAQWTAARYTVTYNANGGTVSTTAVLVTYGETYRLAVPVRAGYTFAGWWTSAEGAGTQLTGAGGESLAVWSTVGNTAVYARWAAVSAYRITYNAAGGTVSPAGETVTYGQSYTLAVPAPRTGWTFGGWYTEPDGAGTQLTYANGKSLVPWTGTSGITVYAMWTITWNISKVTLDAQESTVNPLVITVTYGAYYTLPVPAPRTGYSFGGWYTAANGGGTQLTGADGAGLTQWTASTDLTVYAEWKGNTYTVTYDPDGGTMLPVLGAGGRSGEDTGSQGGDTYTPAAGTVTYGSECYLEVPVRAGYRFAGWYTGANGTGIQVTGADGLGVWNIPEDSTVYAWWILLSSSSYYYTVYYEMGVSNGTVSHTSTTVTYGNHYSLVVPRRAGYAFVGWQSGGITLTDGNGDSIESWTMMPADGFIWVSPLWTWKTYTVTLDANGGTVSPATAVVNYGQPYALPVPTPPSAGYRFEGWYSGVDGTGIQLTLPNGRYDSDVAVSDWPAVVYARWAAAQYTVFYNAQGGTVSPASGTVTYGSSYTLTVPTRSGYAFAGWYSEAGGMGTQLTDAGGAGFVPWTGTANITVYARWQHPSYSGSAYTLTYDAQGGTVSSASTTVTYDSLYTLAVPTRTGYTFVGWYTLANEMGTQLTGANGAGLSYWNIASSIVVYARWTNSAYTVTYDAQDGTVSPASTTVAYGASYSLAVPMRAGYSFGGWYTAANGGGAPLTDANGASLAVWAIAANTTVYARWTANIYLVRLSPESGTVSPLELEVTYGSYYSLPVPTREGHTFVGWYSAGEGGTPLTGANGASLAPWTSTPGAAVTVYARWATHTYTVYLDAAGGTVSPAQVTTAYGNAYFLPVPTRAGYTFGGWYTGANGTGDQLSEANGYAVWNTDAVTRLYARWTAQRYTLNYEGGEGTEVTYGQSYILAVPVRAGYTFVGWWTGANGTGTQLTDAGGASLAAWTGTASITIYACWTANTYTVTYNVQGGTVSPATTTVTYGSGYAFAVPTRTGHNFGGWYTAANGGGTPLTGADGASLATWAIAANTTVYAWWAVATYTLTYDYEGATGGNSAASASVTYNVSSYTLAVPTRAGYTFGGWWTGDNGTGTQLTGANGVSLAAWTGTANITVYARWTVNTYTVTYDAQGGTVSPASTTVTYGASYTLAVPTKTGYSFGGWYTAANGGGTQLTGISGANLAAWTITANTTVYARWAANTYTVTYDARGGTLSLSQTTVTYGASYTLAVPTRAGCNFGGWYTAANGGGTQMTGANGASLAAWTGTANLTVYARWTNTLTCDYQGAVTGGATSVVVDYGLSYTLAVPTWTGYTFGGWYTAANGGGTQLTGANGVSLTVWMGGGDITVYARWTANTYTVTYNAGNGTVSPASTTVTYGIVCTLAVPTRAGYVFGGWWTGANGTGSQITNSSGVSLTTWAIASDITAYAKWTAGTYILTYDYQGATGGNSVARVTVTYDTSYTLAVPTRTGYTFGGWYTAANGGGTQLTGANGASLAPWTGTSSITIYAKWTGNIYTVTYDYEGATFGTSDASATVTYGSSYTLAVPRRVGYTFGGWWTGDDGTGTQLTGANGASLAPWAIASDITVHARWTVNTYTVTYDYQGATGGNSAVSATVTYGASYTLVVPTRTGHTFGGWYIWEQMLSPDAITQLTNADGESLRAWQFDSDITVYAMWTALRYIVTYDYQGATGGNDVVNTSIVYGSSYTMVVPTKTGYDFLGWYTAANGGGIQLTGGNGVGLDFWTTASNITVYAKWIRSRVVTYDYQGADGGNSELSKVITYGYSYTLAVPTRAGYSFGGWWTGVNGTGTQLTGANGVSLAIWTGTSDIIVYAKWTENHINLTTPESSTGAGFSYSNNVFTIANGASITVTGSTTVNRIVVAANARATLVLNEASIVLSGTTSASPIDLNNGANLTLILAGNSNIFKAAGSAAGIHVPAGRTLKITSASGDGTVAYGLKATGGATGGAGAGIGGSMGEAAGTITLAGGIPSAYGGAGGGSGSSAWGGAAAIGGGGDLISASAGRGTGGTITVSGGMVSAAVAETDEGKAADTAAGGAGIGGGYAASGGTINIAGGVTAAYGKAGAAGIGGGSGGASGTINISGGIIGGYGGSGGAGIGGGTGAAGGSNGTINIAGRGNSYDMVMGTGGANGAGLGGGQNRSGGTITISAGARVVVTGNEGGAGLGGGSGGAGGSISISGSTVTATATGGGAGIGGGSGGAGGNISISGNTVTASGGTLGIWVPGGAGIGGGSGGAGGTISITGGTITAAGGDNGADGAGIGGGYGGASGTITISANSSGVATAWGDAKTVGNGTGGTNGSTDKFNDLAVFPTARTFIWPTGSNIDLGYTYFIGTPVGFTYANGVYTVNNGANLTVRGSTTTDRFVVNGTATITIENVSIKLASGSASPIDLNDGANLTLKLRGAPFTSTSGNYLHASGSGRAGIHVPGGRTLKITSADGGDGSTDGDLEAYASSQSSAFLSAAAGIGGNDCEGGGTIIIAGGTIYTRGGKGGQNNGDIHYAADARSGGGAGIGGGRYGGGGTINIIGGWLSSIGYDGGAGIGGGQYGDAGTININNPSGTSSGWAYASYSFTWGSSWSMTHHFLGSNIGCGDTGSGGSVNIQGNNYTENGLLYWSAPR